MSCPQQPTQQYSIYKLFRVESHPVYDEQKQEPNISKDEKSSQSIKKIGLFIGPPAAGRTTLIKKLAESKQASSDSKRHSIDWKIYDCKYYDKQYQLRDTVGIRTENQCNNKQEFECFKEDFYCELNKNQFNRIFIVCKYERIARMKELLTQCLIPIRKYITKMTLIVTHWDLCQSKAYDEELIRKDILSFFKMNQLIFSPQPFAELNKAIYNGCADEPINFDLLDTSFDIIPEENHRLLAELNKFSLMTSQRISITRTTVVDQQKHNEEQYLSVKSLEKPLPIFYTYKSIAKWKNIKFSSIGFNSKFYELLNNDVPPYAESADKEIQEQQFLQFLLYIQNLSISGLFINKADNEIYLKLDQGGNQLTLNVLYEVLTYNNEFAKLHLILIFKTPLKMTNYDSQINYIRIANTNRLISICYQPANYNVQQNAEQNLTMDKTIQIVEQYIDQIKTFDVKQHRNFEWTKKEFIAIGFHNYFEIFLYNKIQTNNDKNYELSTIELQLLIKEFKEIWLIKLKSLCVEIIFSDKKINNEFYIVVKERKQFQNPTHNLMVLKNYLIKYSQSDIIIIFHTPIQIPTFKSEVNYLRLLDKKQLISIIESSLHENEREYRDFANQVDQLFSKISQIEIRQPRIFFYQEPSSLLSYGWQDYTSDIFPKSSDVTRKNYQEYCNKEESVLSFLFPALNQRRIGQVYDNKETKEIFYTLIKDTSQTVKFTFGVLIKFLVNNEATHILLMLGHNKSNQYYNHIRITNPLGLRNILLNVLSNQ